jgi:hypothetical protein
MVILAESSAIVAPLLLLPAGAAVRQRPRKAEPRRVNSIAFQACVGDGPNPIWTIIERVVLGGHHLFQSTPEVPSITCLPFGGVKEIRNSGLGSGQIHDIRSL